MDDIQITGINNNGAILNTNPVLIRFFPITESHESEQSTIENTPNPQQDVLINNNYWYVDIEEVTYCLLWILRFSNQFLWNDIRAKVPIYVRILS